jgi:hypothetical protein
MQEPVAVKALEWRRSGWVEGFAQPEDLGVWYSIQPDKPVLGPGDPQFTCNAIWGVPGQTARECLGETFQSLDEAKAAAQADYEQRIRSALSSSQSDPASEIAALRAENGELREEIRASKVLMGSKDETIRQLTETRRLLWDELGKNGQYAKVASAAIAPEQEEAK